MEFIVPFSATTCHRRRRCWMVQRDPLGASSIRTLRLSGLSFPSSLSSQVESQRAGRRRGFAREAFQGCRIPLDDPPASSRASCCTWARDGALHTRPQRREAGMPQQISMFS